MIEFLRVQYRLGRVTEAQLDMLVEKEAITELEKDYIMSY